MKNDAEVFEESRIATDAFRDTAERSSQLRSLGRKASSRAQPYVLAVVVAGCAVLAASIAELRTAAPNSQWWALVALTLISGSAVLKLPSIEANFSISDVFTLTAAVVYGPAAGTVLVAIDSLVISRRLARTGLAMQRILFNAAAPPVAMWLSAQVFFHAPGFHPLSAPRLEVVAPWLLLFAGMYFLLNTFGIAVAIALHERLSAFAIWRAHFQNLWVTFIGGAIGAGFVVFALQFGTFGMAVLSLLLLLAVVLHFAYRNSTGRVADQLHHLSEVNRLHLSTIEALAHAIDAKDAVTHGHIRRVQSCAVKLASRLGLEDEQQLRALEAAALLHDIGKLAVPEHILNKPGRLTPAEFERMKTHAIVGAEILSEVEFPYPVVPIVRHHHENWDGTGYPDGLRGESIPLGARILSVVDCYDALTSHRPYRRALSAPDAFEIIASRRGSMYDPMVVDAFRDICEAELGTDGDVNGTEAALRPPATMQVNASPTEVENSRDEFRLAMELGAAMSAIEGGTSWQRLADVAPQLPSVDSVAIFAVDERQHRLVLVAAGGRQRRALAKLSMPVGERLSGWVAATRRPLINGDAALDLFDADVTELRTAVSIPCSRPDGTLFVVTLYSTQTDAFSSVHQRLIETAVSFVQLRRNPSDPAPSRLNGFRRDTTTSEYLTGSGLVASTTASNIGQFMNATADPNEARPANWFRPLDGWTLPVVKAWPSSGDVRARCSNRWSVGILEGLKTRTGEK